VTLGDALALGKLKQWDKLTIWLSLCFGSTTKWTKIEEIWMG